jgi:hypothetical protein
VCLTADETAFDLYFVFVLSPAEDLIIEPKTASRWAPFDTLSDSRLAAGLMSWARAKAGNEEEGEHLG